MKYISQVITLYRYFVWRSLAVHIILLWLLFSAYVDATEKGDFSKTLLYNFPMVYAVICLTALYREFVENKTRTKNK